MHPDQTSDAAAKTTTSDSNSEAAAGDTAAAQPPALREGDWIEVTASESSGFLRPPVGAVAKVSAVFDEGRRLQIASQSSTSAVSTWVDWGQGDRWIVSEAPEGADELLGQPAEPDPMEHHSEEPELVFGSTYGARFDGFLDGKTTDGLTWGMVDQLASMFDFQIAALATTTDDVALLCVLGRMAFTNVRAGVASNPRTPRRVFELLLTDAEPGVRRAALAAVPAR
jgi:hypothetical protein